GSPSWFSSSSTTSEDGRGIESVKEEPMSKNRHRGLTRREFAKITGAGAVAAGVGANFLFPARAAAQQKTLKIIQWSHFAPAWDTWFNATYTKDWGEKKHTNGIIDTLTRGQPTP